MTESSAQGKDKRLVNLQNKRVARLKRLRDTHKRLADRLVFIETTIRELEYLIERY